jgi:hypothetical protein
MDLARARKLLGDLEPGVAAGDDEHAAVRNGPRGPVFGAVQLDHGGIEALGNRRHEGHLEGPGGDDHLVGLVGAVVEVDEVAGVALADRADRAVERDGQIEVAGVAGQVVCDLVPPWVAVGITGERQPGQGVVAGRCEA